MVFEPSSFHNKPMKSIFLLVIGIVLPFLSSSLHKTSPASFTNPSTENFWAREALSMRFSASFYRGRKTFQPLAPLKIIGLRKRAEMGTLDPAIAEEMAAFFSKKIANSMDIAEQVYEWFGKKWKDALFLVGPEILFDTEMRGLLQKYMQECRLSLRDSLELVLGGFHEYSSEFQTYALALRDRRGRLLFGRGETERIFHLWAAIDPLRLEQQDDSLKPFLIENLDRAKSSYNINQDRLTDRDIWLLYAASRFQPNSDLRDEGYKYSTELNRQIPISSVDLGLLPVGMRFEFSEESVTTFDEKQGRWKVFNVFLSDDEMQRLLMQSGILAHCDGEKKMHLGTVVYQANKKMGRVTIRLLQSWVRISEHWFTEATKNGHFQSLGETSQNALLQKIRNLGSIEVLLEKAFTSYMVSLGYTMVSSVASYQMYGNFMVPIAVHTAKRINALYKNQGYLPVVRRTPNPYTRQHSRWGTYWWEKKLPSPSRDTASSS